MADLFLDNCAGPMVDPLRRRGRCIPPLQTPLHRPHHRSPPGEAEEVWTPQTLALLLEEVGAARLRL